MKKNNGIKNYAIFIGLAFIAFILYMLLKDAFVWVAVSLGAIFQGIVNFLNTEFVRYTAFMIMIVLVWDMHSMIADMHQVFKNKDLIS